MRRDLLFGVALSAVGLLLGAGQLLTVADGSGGAALRTAPMLAMAATIVFAGAWLVRNDTYVGYTDRVLAWSLGGAAALGSVLVLAFVGRATAIDPLGVILDGLTGGALAGLLVGLYDSRSRERMATIESFARRVEALNQYGKALNRSATIDGISGLAVEAVEFLVAGDGAAFVVVDDETTVVDSTLRGDHEMDVLEAIAAEVDDVDEVEAVRYAETGVDLGLESPAAALVIQVPTDDRRALLVSLSTSTAIQYTDEDVDLLETLAAHVSTALSHAEATTPHAPGTESFPDD
jgi:hypothetical protein